MSITDTTVLNEFIERYKDGSITINHRAYAKKVLERFNMLDCNAISTPIQKETIELGKVDDEQRFPYSEAVGALAYLMVGTLPDIAYAVGVVSRNLENPTLADWLRVKRIMRYIKGTLLHGITYKADKKLPNRIESYSNADHGGDEKTGRSTTRVICRFAGGAISWLSQRQPSVAISTTEAEIVAASEATRELIWLTWIYENLTKLDDVPVLHVDNEAALKLAKNPEFHKRTEHIRIRHFFVREQVLEGNIEVVKIESKKQLADIFTKAVPKPALIKSCHEMGLLKKTD